MYSNHRHQEQAVELCYTSCSHENLMHALRLSILPRNPFYFDKNIKMFPQNFIFLFDFTKSTLVSNSNTSKTFYTLNIWPIHYISI